jgi:hypothetical protein
MQRNAAAGADQADGAGETRQTGADDVGRRAVGRRWVGERGHGGGVWSAGR